MRWRKGLTLQCTGPSKSYAFCRPVIFNVMTTKPSPVGFRRCNAVRPRSAHKRQRHPFAVLPLAPAPEAYDCRAVPLIGPAEHPRPLSAVRAGSRHHKPACDWWRVDVNRGHNPALKRDVPAMKLPARPLALRYRESPPR